MKIVNNVLAKEVDNIFNCLLNAIYPPVCGICGKLNGEFLCKKCRKQLKEQSEFKIEKNRNFNIFFQEHLYLFKYQGLIRNIILDYKFNEKAYLYKTIVNFMLQNYQFLQALKSYDMIVPVPISPKRYFERGYNQSSLIAKELAKQLTKIEFPNELEKQYTKMLSSKELAKQFTTIFFKDDDGKNFKIQYNDNCLLKIKNILPQSTLNKEERRENIQGVYKLRNKESLEHKNILLVDDIYTTGSTVNECSKVLSEAKPKKIGILTIAKD